MRQLIDQGMPNASVMNKTGQRHDIPVDHHYRVIGPMLALSPGVPGGRIDPH